MFEGRTETVDLSATRRLTASSSHLLQTIEQVYSTRYKADCKELELRCGNPSVPSNKLAHGEIPARLLTRSFRVSPRAAQGGMAVSIQIRRGPLQGPCQQRVRLCAVVVWGAVGAFRTSLTVSSSDRHMPEPARLNFFVSD